MICASIDVGSNSVLLSVCHWSGGEIQPLFESSEVTGLGERTRQSGVLGEAGQTKTLAALARAFALANEKGAERIFAAGTMALRISSNATEFTQRAEQQGTPVEVISGQEEARLGFRAVTDDPHFSGAMRITIIDPGGHSTEIVSGEPSRGRSNPDFQHSFPVGTLGIRGEIMQAENPGPEERMRGSVALDNAFHEHPRPDPHGLVVTLGAAGTNLVSLREKLDSWQPEKVHGAELSFEEISRSVGWLCGFSDAERAVLPGLEKGRETTIHIGALILERALAYLKAESTKVSVRGWRHAYLVERMT